MIRLLHFKRLQTRLTVLYMGMFGVALLLVAIAIVAAVSQSARGVVRNELAASGEVYNQIWASRSDQLRQGAGVLAQDFGFREAIATEEEATVRSALDNLRNRQKVDGALTMGVDGYVTASGITLDDAAADQLYRGLESGEIDSGVISIENAPYQAVAAPIMAPALIGWVIFIDRLDEAEMQNLEGLSAIPLSASVLTRNTDGWHDTMGAAIRLGEFVDTQLTHDTDVPATTRTSEGQSMVLARTLPAFDTNAPAALLLSYPMKRAIQPYQSLFIALAVIALAGLGLIFAGTWVLAKGLTRPISALDDAVQRLQQGEHAEVDIQSSDEIGRLASSFNKMAGGIRDREARLTHMALHDQETGLPNRLWLERDVTDRPGTYAVMVGIDRFEIVRNAIGYDAMAQLITLLAEKLSRLHNDCAISRIGAGGLGLVIEADDEPHALSQIDALCSAAESPIKLTGATVDVSLRAGLSISGKIVGGLESAVDRAAIALDQAREAHQRCALFDVVAYGDPGGNLSLISELMSAVQNNEVWLAYQPKFDLRKNAITAVEALMRWQHAKRGFISPDLFITMAEETGHIRPITEWSIRRVIEDQRTMTAAGHPMTISVNISGRLLSDEDFANFALIEVANSGADLCFEITETAVIDNPERALDIIRRFSEAGIEVSIDDYGSGLSSLAYLKRIQADELKIDKAFILSLDENAKDALLVKSTIDLAHSLGMKVTAEGVETAATLALLQGMGCDTAQGYLISRPIALDKLIENLDRPAVTAAHAVSKAKRVA